MFKKVPVICLTLLATALCMAATFPGTDETQKNTLRLGLNKPVEHFDPIYTYDTDALKILTQVYEGLTQYDDSGRAIPALCKNWTFSENHTSIQFDLRTDVYFHNVNSLPTPSRKMKAADVVFCLKRLCTPSENNQSDWILTDMIAGAQAYFDALSEGDTRPAISGIKTLNDSTIQIKLIGDGLEFLHRLTMPATAIYPQELLEKHGADGMHKHLCGTGPFAFLEKREHEIVLIKNQNYYRFDDQGIRLPYLDTLRFISTSKKTDQIDLLQKGKLDAILPSYDMLAYVHKKKLSENDVLKIQSVPKWNSSFYGFRLSDEVFKNKALRQAFNLAIDREKLIQELYQGTAIPATHGIVPPGIADYPYQNIQGFQFDPEKAKARFKEAGFDENNPLPLITLNINNKKDNINLRAAEAIKKMLKEHLGVEIVIEILPFEFHLEMIARSEASFWRDGWTADYLMPENFLYLFSETELPKDENEPSRINTVRFKNNQYDKLFAAALQVHTPSKRNILLAEADQIIIDEAPILLLWHQTNTLIHTSNIKGIGVSGGEHYLLSSAHFTSQ